MLKPSILSLALLLALGSCSKSDNMAATNVQKPLDRAVQPTDPPAKVDSRQTVQAPAPSPKQTAKKAAAGTDHKGAAKRGPTAARDRAQRNRTPNARRWDAFQAVMQRCIGVTLSAREQCLAAAREAYRSSNLDCAALPTRERRECVKYFKLWQDRETDVPIAVEAQDEGAATTPWSPGAALPARYNGDSTTQE